MEVQLHEGERLDGYQNDYKIIQDKSEICFGIDVVLLSWFAKAKLATKFLICVVEWAQFRF